MITDEELHEIDEHHKHLDEISKKIYGKHCPNFIGSPLEGSLGDICERVLHELCHMAFLNILDFQTGHADDIFDNIVWQLDNMPKWKSDLHEIRTLAAELIVAEELGLDAEYQLLCFAHKNLKDNCGSVCRGLVSNETAVRLVQRAIMTGKVQGAAKKVIALYKENGL